MINLKSFADSRLLKLSKGINVIVGKNNAGKSTILQAVLCLQSTNHYIFNQPKEAVRIGASESTIRIRLEEIKTAHLNKAGIADGDRGIVTLSFTPETLPRKFTFAPDGTNRGEINNIDLITHQEPNNFILPYTMKRFAQGFNTLTGNNLPQPRYVLESLAELANKIHPYTQSTHPEHKRFDMLCEAFIGSPIGIIEGTNGHLPGIYTGQNGSIPLSQMGDGVPHILGLIVHLLKAENKLFVIEELENGINPEPLKLLLEEIKRSAKERHNQFLISTHNEIVLQTLASEEDCTIIEVTQARMKPGDIPESYFVQIERDDVEARRRVLRNLGYSLTDSDMFEGWLLLEEASAETIIRRFLIPQFAPKLINVLGIIASRGYNQVEDQFTALALNFLYLHLTPAYKKRIWVIIDAGDREREVIERLKHDFGSWPPEHFDQFGEHDFERYYPPCFQQHVEKILTLPDNSKDARKKKQEAKKELLMKVMQWIDEDRDRARQEFECSAQEVIGKLRNVETRLFENSSL